MSNPIDIVCDYLTSHGYRIVDRRADRSTEPDLPDIVALPEDRGIAFVEVRVGADATTDLTPRDLSRIRAAATRCISKNCWALQPELNAARIDIAVVHGDGTVTYRAAAGHHTTSTGALR